MSAIEIEKDTEKIWRESNYSNNNKKQRKKVPCKQIKVRELALRMPIYILLDEELLNLAVAAENSLYCVERNLWRKDGRH